MGGKSIYMWDAVRYGIPCDMIELDKIFDHLRNGVDDRQHDGFILFAQELRRQLKTHPTLSDEEEVQDLYADLPEQAKHYKEALIHLDLPYDEWVETLRLIMKIAAEFHLVVFEREMNKVSIPSTSRIFPERLELLQDVIDCLNTDEDDFPRTKAQYKKFAKPYFDALMLKHGFQKDKLIFPDITEAAYSRSTPLGKQYTCPSYDHGGGGRFEVQIYTYILNAEVLSIYDKFSFLKTFEIFSTETSRLDSKASWYVTNVKEFRAAITRAETLLFVPLLDCLQNLSSVDRMLNGEPNERLPERSYNKEFHAPQRLIVARLVDNPKFEELVTEFEGYSSFSGNEKARASEWPKLVKYLREEVQPIV